MKESRKFYRSINALEDIFIFLQGESKKYEIGQKEQLDMELCVEELFTNMVRHNKDSTEDIEITYDKTGDEIKLSLKDFEKFPYNINDIPELDLDDYIDKKKSGGLGIHLVKKMMDDIHFEHQNGVSVITIIKRL